MNSSQVDICLVCKVVSSKSCSNCRKVSYCSAEHQKQDWKKHKINCFPAEIQVNDVEGRHFVATKEINQGEIVFKDNALISGPSLPGRFDPSLCIGCYRRTAEGKKCPSCEWPLCAPKCGFHPQFECEIFNRKKIKPSCTAFDYVFICILRGILLTGEEKEKLLHFVSHCESRLADSEAVECSKTVFSIIKKHNLDGITFEVVHRIAGIWAINSYGTNSELSLSGKSNENSKMATYLFPKLGMASHNCIANTRGILNYNKNGKAEMILIATLPIAKGSSIRTTYIEVGEGTLDRRLALKQNYFFVCGCQRCGDATEGGSHYSSIKCNTCVDGYLLPNEPLEDGSLWACNGKTNTCEGKKQILIEDLLKSLKEELKESAGDAGDLESFISFHSGKTLHKNHWLIVEAEFRLMQFLSSSFRQGNIPDKRLKGIIKRVQALGSHLITIANLIRPGFNAYRGRILYCSVEAKFAEILLHPSGDFKEQSKKLDLLKKETQDVIKMLDIEPEGTEEHYLANFLKRNIEEINAMRSLIIKF